MKTKGILKKRRSKEIRNNFELKEENLKLMDATKHDQKVSYLQLLLVCIYWKKIKTDSNMLTVYLKTAAIQRKRAYNE